MAWLSQIFSPTPAVPGGGSPIVAGPTPAPPSPGQQAVAAPAPALPAPPAPSEPTSPLDKFNVLWQNPTTADGKPKPIAADPLTAPIFTLDPASIQASASKMDFTAGIDPSLSTKALQGDAASLGELINQAVRNAVVGVTVNQGQMINNALLANNKNVVASLPTQINRARLNDTADTHPVFSHQAVQPLVASLEQMAFAKDPTVPPAQIKEQVRSYLSGLVEAINDTNKQETAAAKAASGPRETNWLEFVNS
jgi:hypothetical protein